jgi:hypothetical protein
MTKIHDRFVKAIDKHNEKELEACIIELFHQSRLIDKSLYLVIERVMFESWHQQHEDLVNLIYLRNLKDDRFVNPIMKIAEEKVVYRPYDDELESTLRKCIHALKMIDSDESNRALAKLIETGNENIMYALDNYK